MDSDNERKLHKHKKIRKSADREHRDRKSGHDKKDRKQDRGEKRKHRDQPREHGRDANDRQQRPARYERVSPPRRSQREGGNQEPSGQIAIREEKEYIPRTHIQCRRCQNETFSLKQKQCSTCGYPKEERPANFPVVKEIDVMEMIRAGKLTHNSYAPVLIEVIVNDRMGRKQRIKCSPKDTVFDLKKLTAAQIGTRPEKIRLQKSSVIYKDHLTLEDYEIKDGMGLEMYYD